MRAKEIMTPDPFTVGPADKVALAAELMGDVGIGAVPVVEDPLTPVLVGIITDRDIAVRCTARGHSPTCEVRDHMTPPPLQTVLPDDEVSKVLDKMERAQVRRVLVVSGNRVLLGIIAQADIATKVGPQKPYQVEELLERISTPTPELV